MLCNMINSLQHIGALLDRQCRSSHNVRVVPVIPVGILDRFVYVFVCRKLSPYLSV